MDKFSIELLKLLKPLTFQKKLIFGLLTCEKLFLNYEFFSKKYSWGNPNVLQKAILIINHIILQKKQTSVSEIYDLIKEIEAVTPETEDFDTILVSFALDACTSLLAILRFITHKDDEYILEIATYARDTVDMYIQDKEELSLNDKKIEIKIQQDDFMQNEKKRQIFVIETLTKLSEIKEFQLNMIREMNSSPIIDLTRFTP